MGRQSTTNYVKCTSALVQVVDLMGQDMVVYRYDNGVGTVKSKVCPRNACAYTLLLTSIHVVAQGVAF